MRGLWSYATTSLEIEMTYKQAIEQAARSEVTNEVVRKISATYRGSETKVRKDIEAAIRGREER